MKTLATRVALVLSILLLVLAWAQPPGAVPVLVLEVEGAIGPASADFIARGLAKTAKLAQQPQALQLRYLETLTVIAADKNSTIIFPLPIDLPSSLMERLRVVAHLAVAEAAAHGWANLARDENP